MNKNQITSGGIFFDSHCTLINQKKFNKQLPHGGAHRETVNL